MLLHDSRSYGCYTGCCTVCSTWCRIGAGGVQHPMPRRCASRDFARSRQSAKNCFLRFKGALGGSLPREVLRNLRQGEFPAAGQGRSSRYPPRHALAGCMVSGNGHCGVQKPSARLLARQVECKGRSEGPRSRRALQREGELAALLLCWGAPIVIRSGVELGDLGARKFTGQVSAKESPRFRAAIRFSIGSDEDTLGDSSLRHASGRDALVLHRAIGKPWAPSLRLGFLHS